MSFAFSSKSSHFAHRALGVLSIAALLFLAGCKKEQPVHEKGVAVVVPAQSATWLRNFNPFFPSQARWPTSAGVYEPLLVYNTVKQKYVPWLAESYRWEQDARALVFSLREGVKWSDGKPFTAKDVLFTWQLMKKHKALDATAMWSKLESVTADGSEVTFLFKKPFVPGIFFVGQSPIVAQHIWKDVKDPIKFRNETPVGTGPFTEVRSFKTQVYELGKNPHYWQEGRPYLDAIRVPAFPGNEQASLALIRGEIDWAALFIPAIDRIFVKKNPKYHGYHFPKVEGTVMLYPNTTRKPLNDVRVRKAISHALDRERIVRIAMQGYTIPADATGLSDLYKKYKNPKVLEEEGNHAVLDLAKANALLDEAGLKRGPDGMRLHPGGKPLHFDVNCVVGWSDWIIAAQIIVKNLQELGISAKLRTYEFGAWFSHLQRGDFDLSLSWSSGGPTLYTFYRRQMASSTFKPIGEPAEYNWQRFKSPEADKLLDELAGTTDEARQLEISTELQRIFVRNAPAFPLFPGPPWGEFNSERIEGFPSEENPFAALAPYKLPGAIQTLVNLRPRGTPPTPGSEPGVPFPKKAGN